MENLKDLNALTEGLSDDELIALSHIANPEGKSLTDYQKCLAQHAGECGGCSPSGVWVPCG